jgi:hypothetical protein
VPPASALNGVEDSPCTPRNAINGSAGRRIGRCHCRHLRRAGQVLELRLRVRNADEQHCEQKRAQ